MIKPGPWSHSQIFFGEHESDIIHLKLSNGMLKNTVDISECYCCSCVTQRVQLCATLWTVAVWAPLSMGFPRQEDWRGSSFPSPGELPSPGTKPMSLGLAGTFFTTEPPANTFLHSIQGSVFEVLFTPISFSFFRVIVPNVQFPDPVLCRDFEILS